MGASIGCKQFTLARMALRIVTLSLLVGSAAAGSGGLLSSILNDNHHGHDQNASAACDPAAASSMHNTVLPSSFAAFFPDAAAPAQADHFLPDISSANMHQDHHAGDHASALDAFFDQRPRRTGRLTSFEEESKSSK